MARRVRRFRSNLLRCGASSSILLRHPVAVCTVTGESLLSVQVGQLLDVHPLLDTRFCCVVVIREPTTNCTQTSGGKSVLS